MVIELNGKETKMDRNIHHTAEQLFGFSLNRFNGLFSRLNVRFWDGNCPKECYFATQES